MANSSQHNPLPLIRISNARCRIGRDKILDIPNLALNFGQHWCLFGGNGSGKSLLAKLLMGDRTESTYYVDYASNFDPKLNSFWVSFDEQQKLWERDNRLDMSEYSDDAYDPGTTVATLVRSSREKQDLDTEFESVIFGSLGLEKLVDHGIRFLSSGQVRKALLGRALYAKRGDCPIVIILDEPFETIDTEAKTKLLQSIGSLISPNTMLLQLCRREREILPLITHIAIMDDLKLSSAGFRQSYVSPLYQGLQLPLPQLPEFPGFQEQTTDVALIDLRHVSASYGDKNIFDGFSWVMSKGDNVLIEGPNGCGKSTLLSLINGENHKAYGQDVWLFGKRRGSGETIWEIKNNFGLVSNELHSKYIKGWKVLDVVVSGFFDTVGLYDTSGSVEREESQQWLQSLQLASVANNRYCDLSFGQQRLVLLARAMVKKPRILIMDEPCVGLDDNHREIILNLLDEITSQSLTQLIFVSHISDERPKCLNKRLSFIDQGAGHYMINESLIETR